jgi:hypothetical protein
MDSEGYMDTDEEKEQWFAEMFPEFEDKISLIVMMKEFRGDEQNAHEANILSKMITIIKWQRSVIEAMRKEAA